MSRRILLRSYVRSFVLIILALSSTLLAVGQTPGCAPKVDQKLSIYHAGSLTAAFKPVEAAFTCQTGVQIKDVAGPSVEKARQCTSGGDSCDVYATADSSNINLFLKPAGYTDFTIVFAQGRMVLGYTASGLAQKKLPPIADPNSGQFNPPNSIPKAVDNWYQILTAPGVAIGGGVPYLDPGAYRAYLIFQLAQAYYKVPMLDDNLLEHIVIPNGDRSVAAPANSSDFQLLYEHNARAASKKNPDYRYVDLPDAINLSDPLRNAYYMQNAVVALPGLGTNRSAQMIPVPASRVTWGVTIMKDAPHRENAIKFLQLLFGPIGTASLTENGPTPISPAHVTPNDLQKLPESLRTLVKSATE